MSKKERERYSAERQRERERERRQRERCVTQHRGVQICSSCFSCSCQRIFMVVLFITFCRIMRATRWRAAASHLFPLHIFATSLPLGTFEEGTERTGSTGTVCAAERESVSECGKRERETEREVSVCSSHILCSAVFWSCRDAVLKI